MRRVIEGLGATLPTEKLARYLEDAAHLYDEALEMMPETDIVNRGIAHNSLAGSVDRALHHFGQSIRYSEEASNIFNAGETRRNVAASMFAAGRLDDARTYAEAARANFQTFGHRATADIQRTKEQKN